MHAPGSAGLPLKRALVVAAALILLAGILVLHHEALLFGRVYHMDDAADGYYPSHVAIWRAFAAGQLPTWERGAWSGWPLIVGPYYGAFYPPNLLFPLIGMVRGLAYSAALHSLGAALGMLWLLGRRRLDVGPALLGAVSFGFSSFMVERIRHLPFVQLMAWVPLLLVAIDRYLDQRRRRDLALLALATGMGILCGALPLLPFVGMVVIAYSAPRLGKSLGAAGWLLAAAGAGVLLGMAQLAPTIAHLSQSARSLGVDERFAASYAWPDGRYLGTLLVPNLFGRGDRGHWFGAYNHWEMAGFYAGALVVCLAPFGLLRRRPELYALMGVALLGIGLALGDRGPFHTWFFHHFAWYRTLRCPTRALVMVLLALPILAAEGLTWILARSRARPRSGLWALLLTALAVAAVLAVAAARPRTDAARAFLHLVLIVAVGAALVAATLAGVWRARVGGVAIALLTLVDLVLIGRGYVQPKPADFATGTERFAAVDWLLAQHPEDRFVPAASGPFRLHNLGMTYGIEAAGGYDSVAVWRYVNFLYVINNGAPYPYRQLKHDLAAGEVQRFDTSLIDLLNLRWAIATVPPAPGWIERFRPDPLAPLHARYEPDWDRVLNVYENPHPLPRAFVVYAAEVQSDDGDHARALSRLDPRRLALLDRAPQPPPSGDGRMFTPARLVTADRHRLVIEAELDAPGILVVSETFYTGWSASVDQHPAELLRADYAFRGVALPAGRHLVEMRYRSRPTELGLGLSALGVVLLVGLSVL